MLEFLRGTKIMKLATLTIFLLLLSPSTWSQEQPPQDISEEQELYVYRKPQFINLTLGIEQDVNMPKLPGNFDLKGDFRRIVSVQYQEQLNIFRFIPKGEGFGTLTIHDKRNGRIVAEYRIDVKKNKLDKVVKEIQSLIGDIEGISIKVINNKVVVDGQVLLPRDLSRIIDVVKQFGDQASTIVTMSPVALKKIAEMISREINNPEVEVQAINDKIILKGFVNSAEEQARAEIIAKTYLPAVVVNPNTADIVKERKPANDGIINLIVVKATEAAPAKMVQLVVHFVELNKDYGKSFNFGWTPQLNDNSALTITTGDGGGGVVSQLTATISNLLPKLNSAKEHGHARILESTSLIVENAKEGSIKQVTNVPYPVIGKDGEKGTAFAEIGIMSKIKPVILEGKSNSINMVMNFNLSNMVGVGAGGAPISSQNSVTSEVTVRDRQSAAIGGLIRNSSSTSYNRMPSNIKNPIVSLYASKEFQRKQSQFVVFVTPIIKASASTGAEQIKKKFRLHE